MMPPTAPQQVALGVLSATVLLLGTSNAAQAAVLINNGVPNLELAVRSDFDFPVEAGDNFTFSTSSDVTNVTWSGLYARENDTPGKPPIAVQQATIDQFSVRIFKFLNDQPANVPVVAFNNVNVNRSSTANPFFFSYSFALPQPLTLNAGNYLLSIVNNTESDPVLDWFWAASKKDGNDLGRFQPDSQWFKDDNTAELSFALAGDRTPVPTPALLPGLICLGLGAWRKRKLAGKMP